MANLPINVITQGLLAYQYDLLVLASEAGIPIGPYLKPLNDGRPLSEVQLISLQVSMGMKGLSAIPPSREGIKSERAY